MMKFFLCFSTVWPKCTNSGALTIPLDIGDSHKLLCNIVAWPADLNFHWTLNGSHEIIPVLNYSLANRTKTYNGVPFLEEYDDYISPFTRSDYEPSIILGLDHEQGSGSGIPPQDLQEPDATAATTIEETVSFQRKF
jgi:hypothetical protein